MKQYLIEWSEEYAVEYEQDDWVSEKKIVRQLREKRIGQSFEVGDLVLAIWSDGHSYPGQIVEIRSKPLRKEAD